MSIKIKENKTHVLKTAEKYCECDIVIEPVVESADELGKIIPTTKDQNIYPDEGFVGIGSVYIKGVTSDIDEDIKPENIKEGIEILGVKGTYVKKHDPNLIPENIAKGVTIYDVTGTLEYAGTSPTLLPKNIKFGTTILGVCGEYLGEPTGGFSSFEETRIFETPYGAPAGTGIYIEGYRIKAYDSYDSVVTIPSEYNGLPVIDVNNIFVKNSFLKVLNYPSTILSISSEEFANSMNLETINIACGEYTTFSGSSGLSYFKNLNMIGKSIIISSIYACKSVTTVNISCTDLVVIKSDAFRYHKKLTTVKLSPAFSINIGFKAFADIESLKSFDLSSFVEGTTIPTLDLGVFDDCSSDFQIKVPESRVEEFKNTSGWSTYAPYIVGV